MPASGGCSVRRCGRSCSSRGSGCAARRSGSSSAGGLFEFRLREENLLLRVFCHAHGSQIVLLLSGYDMGEDPGGRRRQREIAEARKRLAAWRQRQDR
jgi:hypothetical protein